LRGCSRLGDEAPVLARDALHGGDQQVLAVDTLHDLSRALLGHVLDHIVDVAHAACVSEADLDALVLGVVDPTRSGIALDLVRVARSRDVDELLLAGLLVGQEDGMGLAQLDERHVRRVRVGLDPLEQVLVLGDALELRGPVTLRVQVLRLHHGVAHLLPGGADGLGRTNGALHACVEIFGCEIDSLHV